MKKDALPIVEQQAMAGSGGTLASVPLLQVNDKFQLNQDEACYTLSIETEVPLDLVMLQVKQIGLMLHDM